jgi:hypothetical protein
MQPHPASITALQPTSATTTTTHMFRRGLEIGPWARKPHDPNRCQAEDDIPSEPVVADLAVNEAAEPRLARRRMSERK